MNKLLGWFDPVGGLQFLLNCRTQNRSIQIESQFHCTSLSNMANA